MKREEALKDLKKLIKKLDKQENTFCLLVALQALVRASPEVSAYWRYLLGDTLRVLGRASDAEKILQEIRQVPEVPKQHRYLIELSIGELYRDRGEYERAEQYFRSATQLNPTSTVPWVYLGVCLTRQEKFERAIEVFERGLTARGDHDEILDNIGRCKLALNDAKGAKDCFEKSLSLEPNSTSLIAFVKDLETLPKVKSEIDRLLSAN